MTEDDLQTPDEAVQIIRLGDGRFDVGNFAGELGFGGVSCVCALGVADCFSRQLANLRFVLSIPGDSQSEKNHQSQ